MNNAPPISDNAPLLRTLAPALRTLGNSLRAWLDRPHRHPLSVLTRATLEGVATDLRRKAEDLDVDRPLLVIMLMGGTGVGKSTLLNALAGGRIAKASFTRPTTRDPVVYYHESIRPDRLDPALRHCRLVPHDRPALEQKILVDTPDLDSNDLANRDKLLRLLPVADIVLYVGSQEKYHDQLGWEIFLQQRRRRAFAFILNKWDRCLHTATTGLRPDEDMIRDLKGEGFELPLLFRTCAQKWVDWETNHAEHHAVQANGAEDGAVPSANDRRDAGPTGQPPDLPQGEQFRALLEWIEQGLTRLEIEAIKARGVSQLLAQMQEALQAAAPPDLSEVAERTRSAWARPLAEEAAATAEVLLNTLDPYQREIEHHFALEGHRRFRGPMAGYLRFITRTRYAGSTLTRRLPVVGRAVGGVEPPLQWDLSLFTRACSDVAANRQLDSRSKALTNRLLVEADQQGFPLNVLSDTVESRALVDWRQRYAADLGEVLQQVEQQWMQPTGMRRVAHTVVIFVANWLPLLALIAAIVVLLWRYFYLQQSISGLIDLLSPLIALGAVLIIMHMIIALLLPLRWPAIRGEFQEQLEVRLREELESVYNPIPGDVAEELLVERRQTEKLIEETHEVATWLQQREQSGAITGLYGN